jgi:D-glycero-alpha-D-manno-heptose-7-phosphate kinase
VTVGALHAVYTYLNRLVQAECLAQEACQIEIEILGKPIGVQDQYIAAFGGLRFMEFKTDGQIQVKGVPLDPLLRQRLNESLLLFYTGITRRADNILEEQKKNINGRLDVLRKMKSMAYTAYAELLKGNLDVIGDQLHESWELKKQLASQISNPNLDALYATARRAGAIGGKITGAGGGGFLLFYCPFEKREAVRQALSSLRELPFKLEHGGSKVIFNYRRS